MTAPEGSVTKPVNVPVATCADALDAKQHNENNKRAMLCQLLRVHFYMKFLRSNSIYVLVQI